MHYNDEYRCPLCATRHSLRVCRRFLVMSPSEKTRLLKKNKFCINCLGLSHQVQHCRSIYGCHICSSVHNTLIHPQNKIITEWLQMTAWVKAQRTDIETDKHDLRVLMDPNVAESYYIDSVEFPFSASYDMNYLTLQLTDRHDDVRTLTTKLRRQFIAPPLTPQRQGIADVVFDAYSYDTLADYAFNIPYGCSIVLGADVAQQLYLGLPKRIEKQPFAQKTIFGWSFFGDILVDRSC